tara:strand:- start:3635 stop:4354 length:720 start_codon:yes stop_codon:yes gene_type:complete
MADVSFPYTATNGSALDIDGLNRDIDSNTNGHSVYGELRGNVEFANLHSTFQARAEHIAPGETSRHAFSHGREPLEYFQDVFSPAEVAGTFVPVAQASCRVYLPYAASVVLWWAQTFTHCWRLKERISDDLTNPAPSILIRCYRGTTSQSFTTRLLPETINVASNNYAKYNDDLTRHYSLCMMDENVSAGWHDMTLRLYMDPNEGIDLLDLNLLGGNVAVPANHKVVFGTRNAGVIALL